MNTADFLKKLSTLTALSEGKRARARAIATDVSDEQRTELLAKLEEANKTLREIRNTGDDIAEDAEHLITDFEKLIKKTKRTVQEQETQQADLQSAEEHLSSNSPS